MVYVAIVAVIALLAYLAFSVFTGTSSPTASESASPSVSASTTPSLGKSLVSTFQSAGNALTLKADGTAADDLVGYFGTSQPAANQALRVPVNGPFSASLADFLGGIGLTVPSDLKAALGSDWVVLSFGQTEKYDQAGQKSTNSTTEPRMVLISVLQDASKANQAMQAWEGAGLKDLNDVFGFDKTKASVATFSDGSYRQVAIRYQNYPYSDQSLDYAVVLGTNGRNYLVVSSSKQSMLFAIDQLMR